MSAEDTQLIPTALLAELCLLAGKPFTEHANYVAKDDNGEWWWYKEHPRRVDNGWLPDTMHFNAEEYDAVGRLATPQLWQEIYKL